MACDKLPAMTDTTAPIDPKTSERKGTRNKLLRAALSLLAEDRGGLAGLSLREITRRIGVSPTAFYRHFPGMEELGLTLIHESGETLCKRLDKASTESPPEDVVHNTVQVFLDFVGEHREIFIMIAREQVGGSKKMRAAISKEIAAISAQLAEGWSFNDLPSISNEQLMRVVNMSISLAIGTLPTILNMGEDDKAEMTQLADELEQQLNLLMHGVVALELEQQ